jgi:hypothetical protein
MHRMEACQPAGLHSKHAHCLRAPPLSTAMPVKWHQYWRSAVCKVLVMDGPPCSRRQSRQHPRPSSSLPRAVPARHFSVSIYHPILLRPRQVPSRHVLSLSSFPFFSPHPGLVNHDPSIIRTIPPAPSPTPAHTHTHTHLHFSPIALLQRFHE